MVRSLGVTALFLVLGLLLYLWTGILWVLVIAILPPFLFRGRSR